MGGGGEDRGEEGGEAKNREELSLLGFFFNVRNANFNKGEIRRKRRDYRNSFFPYVFLLL